MALTERLQREVVTVKVSAGGLAEGVIHREAIDCATGE